MAQRSSQAMAVLATSQTQKYDVGDVVAKGGMGAILRARDLNIRRTVAMKVMLRPDQAPEQQVLRFIEEAQVTGQLEHPSIVPVHELGVDADGRAFYTMKFVHGTNLKHILKAIAGGSTETIARYPLGNLLTIFLKACDAVAFAHSRGVVHRDLKPENIMVGEFGEVLVMDWGLAKILAEAKRPVASVEGGSGALGGGLPPSSGFRLRQGYGGQVGGAGRPATSPEPPESPPGLRPGSGSSRVRLPPSRSGSGPVAADDSTTQIGQPPCVPAIDSVRADSADAAVHTLAGQIMGSPLFMAPEQAEGRIDAIDARTDIYALGAILYNLLALRPPVEGKTLQAVLLDVRQGNITPPTALKVGVSGVECGGGFSQPSTINHQPFLFPHCPGGRIPAALSAVAMKALALKPESRYQTVKDLQSDVERYQTGFATAAEQAGLWRQLQLLVLRHKGFVTAAVLVFLAVTVGLVVSVVQWRTAVRAEVAEKQQRQVAESARGAAEKARGEAETRRDQAEYESYRALIGLAQGHLDRGDIAQARVALSSCPERFRHWEWGFLSRQCRCIEESTITGGYGYVQVTMSRDGKRVAWPTYDGVVVEAVGGGGRQVVGPKTKTAQRNIQLTADGESVAILTSQTNTAEGALELYRVNTGERLWQTKVLTGGGCRVAASPSGPYAVAGGGYVSSPPFRPFSLVDLRTGAVLGTLGDQAANSLAAVWMPDGRHVCIAAEQYLHLYSMETREVVRRFTGHTAVINDIAVTPDGQRLASAGADATVRLWDVTSGTQVATFWHSAQVEAVLFVSNGRYLLGGGADGTLCVWEVASGHLIGMVHGPPIWSLAAAPGTQAIYIGYTNASLRRASLGEITGRELTERLTSLLGSFYSGGIAFSCRGDALLFAPAGRLALLAPDARNALRVVAHSVDDYPWSMAWDGADTAPVAAGYCNGDVRVWDLREGRAVHEFKGDRHASDGAIVCWVEPGKILAAGGQAAGEVNLYDTGTGQLVRRLSTEVNLVLALALSPDHKALYVGGDTGFTAFDVGTWQPVPLALSPRAASAYAVAFSPNGEWLAVIGYSGGTLGTRLWRTGRNEMHACVEGVSGARLAFTADSRRLAVGSTAAATGAITILDPERGAPLLTLTDHGAGIIYGLAFSPDSRRLASTATSVALPLLSRKADPWSE